MPVAELCQETTVYVKFSVSEKGLVLTGAIAQQEEPTPAAHGATLLWSTSLAHRQTPSSPISTPWCHHFRRFVQCELSCGSEHDAEWE